MKKLLRLILVLALCALALTAVAAAATVLPTDVSTASSGCTLVGLSGSYLSDAQAALDRINAIRYEACQEGIINPADGEPLTLSDYVPLKWSSDLEYIARIRSAEGLLTMNHIRTNGTSIWTLTSTGGVSFNAEDLYWSSAQSSMVAGVNSWYSEKSDWVNKTGKTTGHYTSMINPNYHYVALGCFYSTDVSGYRTCVEACFSTKTSGLSETMGAAKSSIIQTLEVKNSCLGTITAVRAGSDDLHAGDTDTIALSVSSLATNYSSTVDNGQAAALTLAGTVTWTSSDTSVLKVDNSGNLTAVKCGSALISGYVNGTLKAAQTVTVAHNYTMTLTGTPGQAKFTCSACGNSYTGDIPLPESNHNYDANTDKTYSYTLSGASSIQVTFSSDTKVENYYDYIYVLDGDGSQIGKYTGTALAGQTVTVPGDTVKIRLTSDSSTQYYGFRVTKIAAVAHTHTVVTDPAVAATCTATGLTAGSHCSECGAVLVAQTTVPAKGHTSVNDAAVAASCTTAGKTAGSHCSVCGLVLTAQTMIPATGHSCTMALTSTAGIGRYTCSVCGYSYTATIPMPESEHNYANNIDETYTYTLVGATSLNVTFSSDTYVEGSYDFIYILDGDGNQIGKYTAGALAGETVTVPGNTVKIRLTSDSSTTKYGFRVTSILSAHTHTVVTDAAVAATCTTAGKTAGSHCSDCGEVIVAQTTIPATGHTVVNDAAVAATCTSSGKTAGTHCSVCGKILTAQTTVAALGHNYASAITTAATCTTAGVRTYTCSRCGNKYTASISATGHTAVTDAAVAATCTTAGKTAGSHCSVCGKVLTAQTTVPATGHSYHATVNKEATCTETGTRVYACTVCGHAYSEGIPATGHSYTSRITTAATCTTAGVRTYTCSNCGDTYTQSIAATGHTAVTDAAVAATCTTAGKTAGSHCSVCGKVLTAQTTVPATGHSYTMAQTGTAGKVRYTCSVCGYSYTADAPLPESDHNYANSTDKSYSYAISGADALQVTFSSETEVESGFDYIYILDADGYQVGRYTGTELAGQIVTVPGDTVVIRLYSDGSVSYYGFRVTEITSHTHTVVTDAAVAATCTTEGRTAGSHCSVCGEVLTAQTTVAAKGHTVVNDPAVAATCTTTGLTAGTHCSVCGKVLTGQTTVAKLDHSYTSRVTTAAGCTTSGVRTYTCSICGNTYTETIAAAGHTAVTDAAVAPTCTSTGLTEGTHCSVCGRILTAQTTVAKTDHNYTSAVTTAPTCTAKGVRTYTCRNCGRTYTENIAAAGHTAVTDPAAAPTCTADGLTEGSHCSVCGTILTAQVSVPATGHSYVSEITIAPTVTEQGLRTYTCQNCGDSYTETIACTECSHSYNGIITTQPTCTTTGVRTYTCGLCGDSYTETIAATGHTIVTDPAVAPTCTADGLTAGTHCSVCGTVLTAQTTVPAVGHTPAVDPGYAPTCTDPGWTDGSYCVTCGITLTEQTEIPATGHTEVTDPDVAATCTETGLTAGSHCSACGTVLTPQQTVAATGHSYTSAVTKEAGNGESGIRTYTCTKCGDSYTEVIPATGTLRGDLTGDGMVNIVDALKLFRYVNRQLTGLSPYDGDMNADGTVNIVDALRLFRYVNGQITSL